MDLLLYAVRNLITFSLSMNLSQTLSLPYRNKNKKVFYVYSTVYVSIRQDPGDNDIPYQISERPATSPTKVAAQARNSR